MTFLTYIDERNLFYRFLTDDYRNIRFILFCEIVSELQIDNTLALLAAVNNNWRLHENK